MWRCHSQRILSAYPPINSRSRNHFCRGHSASKFHPPLRISRHHNSGRPCCHDCCCGQRLALLRAGGPTGSSAGKNGDDGNRATFILPAGLHRRSDHLERSERVTLVVASVMLLPRTSPFSGSLVLASCRNFDGVTFVSRSASNIALVASCDIQSGLADSWS